MKLIEDEELRMIEEEVLQVKRELEKKNNEMLTLIDVIGQVLREEEEHIKKSIYVYQVDTDSFIANPDEVIRDIQSTTLYNFGVRLQEKIDGIRKGYNKGVEV